jgi:hypothetical protein
MAETARSEKTTTIGRPPATGVNRSAWLQIRVTPAELELYNEAGQRRGLDLSAWVRAILNRAEKRSK